MVPKVPTIGAETVAEAAVGTEGRGGTGAEAEVEMGAGVETAAGAVIVAGVLL